MKKILVASVLLIIFSIPGFAAAEEKMQRILLRDKSVIIGQVLEMKDNVYTIKTDAMGEFKIGADKILEISALELVKKRPVAKEAAAAVDEEVRPEIAIRDGSRVKKTRQPSSESSEPAAGSGDLARQQDQVNSHVRSMTMNGEFLDSMMDLGQNSSMMDIMSDPEIMDAISRNDYDFLMNSDKMKDLMDSPEIKNLLGDIQP